MSLFLGKIHYWLYEKIKNFESLENPILEWAKGKGLPVDEWVEEVKVYGEPVGTKTLEEVVDTNNIHGSLQDKISIAELRHAYFITKILKENENYIEDLKKVFEEEGKRAAIGRKAASPEEVYDHINDYLLEGMPCDNVNRLISTSPEELEYESSICLHETYWDRVGGNVENFYLLRDYLLKGFVESLGYTYKRVGNSRVKIVK